MNYFTKLIEGMTTGKKITVAITSITPSLVNMEHEN